MTAATRSEAPPPHVVGTLSGEPAGMTRRDHLFFVFLGAYAGFALSVLLFGAVAAVAGAMPPVHDALHDYGVLSTLPGRIAEAMAKAAHHSQPPLQLAIDYGFSLFNLALAAALIWLRPCHPTARLLVLGMIGTAPTLNLQAYSVWESLESGWFDQLLHDGFHIVAALSYVLALVLFPDGCFVPRWSRGRLIALYLALGAVVLTLGRGLAGTSRTLAIMIVFGLLTPLVGVASQAYRYGRSRSAVERQQGRLLFWALSPALVLGLYALTQTESAFLPFEGRPLVVIPVQLFRIFQPVFAIIPIAVFVGILRFRLWDIDRIVSRAVTYVLLSGLLLGVYGAGIVLIGWLMAPINAGNSVAVAGATLAAAALLSPARRRIQDLVDRRFNRARYDAQRAVDAFRARLQHQFDLEEVRAELLAAMDQTVQPAHASVWLRSEARTPSAQPANGVPVSGRRTIGPGGAGDAGGVDGGARDPGGVTAGAIPGA
jgi:hypothetical protein